MPNQQYLDLLRDVGETRIPALLKEMEDLHIRKSAGYAGADNPDAWANFRACEEDLGIETLDGIATRMSDKWRRFCSLYRDRSNDQVGETILDTAKDFASYLLIFCCLYRETQ